MLNFLAETFLLGLRNLRLHKLRSLLTALGIIFGVAAVIVMVAIGEGAKQAAMEQMQQLGARNILIRSVKPPESSEATGRTSRMLKYGITRADVPPLRTLEHLALDTPPGVDPPVYRIVQVRDTEQKVTRGDVRANAQAIAAEPMIFEIINLPLSRGRYYTEVDERSELGPCPAVIGSAVARQLFPYQDPIGEKILIGTGGMGGATLVVTVVGVLDPTGLKGEGQQMIGRDFDHDVYFPFTRAQREFNDRVVKREAGSNERKEIQLSEVWLQADSIDNVEYLAARAENVLRANHPALDVDVKAPIQLLRSAEKVRKMFNFILIGIASFALVVGGIGIMNIMLATVTERTREIGIRRALGAKRRHITLQFLIETTVISLAGGLIGIGVGVGFAWLVEWLTTHFSAQPYPTSVTTWSALGSFIISGIIGIGFGLYPAIMAARMNPIEALRHE